MASYARAVALSGLVLTVMAFPVAGLAAPAGITVSPPFRDVSVGASGDAKFIITLFNTTKNDQTLSTRSVDFKSLDETGGVAFMGKQADDLTRKYGLSKWLSTDANTVTVPKGGSQGVAVTVNNRADLGPGGHYGAILFQIEASPGAAAQNPVSFKEVIASLVLLKKIGGEHYGLVVKALQGTAQIWKLPSHLALEFKNTGNVHLVPRGTIALIDPFGRVVSKGIINQESGYILPESTRVMSADLTSIDADWIPGFYHVDVAYRYDGIDKVQRFKRTVFLLNILGVLMLILVPILLIAGFLGYKKYRRRKQILPWPTPSHRPANRK